MWQELFKPKKTKKQKKSIHFQTLSENGLKSLIHHEGSRAFVYKDVAGYLTIGVGHLLTKTERLTGKIRINGINVGCKNGLTETEIKQLLRQDIEKFERAVNQLVKVNMTQNQFDSLVSFVFNVGVGAFKRSTLLKYLNNSRYQDVPEQLKRWNKAGGREVKGLAYRRKAEAKLWETTAKGQTNDVFS